MQRIPRSLGLITFLFKVPFAAAALSVGPDYHRPDVPLGGPYRDAPLGTWQVAAPADAADRGAWWRMYSDPVLNDLETQAVGSNQDLRAAAARLEEARASLGARRSEFWPSASLDGSVERSRSDVLGLGEVTSSTNALSLDASWELDLFGRVRRLVEGARAEAQSSAALFQSVRLAVTAEVASDYFALRSIDSESELVGRTASLRREEMQFVRNRFESGLAADLDVAQAETELATTEAEAAALARRRAALSDALAVLVNRPPQDFLLPSGRSALAEPPAIPAGLPADLLERRPDVAAAERALAAANARIGVAKAAFFPAIRLTGGAGYDNLALADVFRWDSRAWSLGPSISLPIFQGGRNRANLDRSRASFDESVAVYRKAVLTALREVQDALSAGGQLAVEAAAQGRAVAGARRSAEIASARYASGYASYLEVVESERTALLAQQSAVRLSGERLVTSVSLVKALGGPAAAPGRP